jgi:DNA-binding NarL/FixJ family response regulator
LIHVFGKLGVSDRTAAVTVALERGLLHLKR